MDGEKMKRGGISWIIVVMAIVLSASILFLILTSF
jgi:hypothetical protein